MRRTPAFVAFLAILLIGGAAGAQSRQDFRLVNATGYPISEVYVSPTGQDDWGDDILGRDTLEEDQTVDIQFSRQATGCKWDLLVRYEDDGSKVVWRGFDLCTISAITIRYNRKTDQTSASTE